MAVSHFFVQFLSAHWYHPQLDDRLTYQERYESRDINYHPCIEVSIKYTPRKELVFPHVLEDGLQPDGTVLMRYNPLGENEAIIGSFDTPDHFDLEAREKTFILEMSKEEVTKAKQALSHLKRPKMLPPSKLSI